MVCLSSAAWFTSGEAWDSVFPSFLVTGFSGACKCCWSKLRIGQYLQNSAGVHTPGQLKAVQHPCLHTARQSCYVDFVLPGKTFLLAIFLYISGLKFIKRLTTQGALQLHHLHHCTESRSPPASDQFKRKKLLGRDWKQNWMKNVFLKRTRISRI